MLEKINTEHYKANQAITLAFPLLVCCNLTIIKYKRGDPTSECTAIST